MTRQLPLFDLPDPAPPAAEDLAAALAKDLAALVAAGFSFEGVQKLHAAYRGCGCVHVPKHVPPGHPLERILGPEDAQVLARVAGGRNLSIAKGLWRQPVRDALIRRDLDAGLTLNEVCRRYDLASCTVVRAGKRTSTP